MKTQTYKYISIAVIALATTFTSCKKYLEDAVPNPNEPENASAKVLLANVEVATFSNYTGNNPRRSGVFMQQLSGTAFQMQDIANYQVLESDVVNDWITMYSGALVNAQIIIDKYGPQNPYYAGIAKILKAMNLGLATDMWGDIPNREALKGIENLEPHYDDQQTVLSDIQALLSEGISDLQKPLTDNQLFPAEDDFIYNGDPASWIAMAYVLKARYANRLSERSPSESTADALNFLNQAYSAGFSSSASNAMAKFGPGGSESNQWAVFNQNRGDYIKTGAFFIDTLIATNDPRLPFFADTLSTGGYAGGALSNADPATSSDIGIYLDDPTAPLPMVSFVEAKFIEAEVKLRNGDAGGAATAYNDAVMASIMSVTGGSDPAYEAIYAAATAGTITLDMIMMQKYIALYGQVEPWSDWRRTDRPALSPNPNGQVSGIPRRYPTSVEERNYNSNAKVVTNLLEHVWWDL